MDVKLLEVRDEGTYLPCIAIRCDPANEAERYMLARAGYGRTARQQRGFVLFAPESDPKLRYNPYEWGDRTRETAHAWIANNWDDIATGDVVDVRVILGEQILPARPERELAPCSPHLTIVD